MKSINKILFIITLLFCLSCASDDDNPAANLPPGSFSLTMVSNNATDVNLTPEFSWTAANDPDNDVVTYDFYLDINNNPSTLVGANLNATTFTITSALSNATTYFWKVIAKDGNGGESLSDIFTFTTLAAANQPPIDFDLLTVQDQASGVELMASFSWETAVDPDADAVTYDVFLGNQTDPTIKVASDISTTSYNHTVRLPLLSNYYWKVVAKDGQGGERESDIFSFTTRNINSAQQMVDQAPFMKRSNQSAVVFDNKLWMIGGTDNLENFNDVWNSENGQSWVSSTSMGNFEARDQHTSVVFDNRMWVVAGRTAPLEDDVWYSMDGVNWNKTVENADFPQRASHTTVTFDNRMWVIGGNGNNDVWYSDNGTSWTEATSKAAFSGRFSHASVVFEDKIWVIGGDDGGNRLNDVWYSEDGIAWTQATNSANFPARSSHQVVVLDDKMWLIGGVDTNTYFDDVWYSEDGVTWTQAFSSAGYLPRADHVCLVLENKIFVIAGFIGGQGFSNDVWMME